MRDMGCIRGFCVSVFVAGLFWGSSAYGGGMVQTMPFVSDFLEETDEAFGGGQVEGMEPIAVDAEMLQDMERKMTSEVEEIEDANFDMHPAVLARERDAQVLIQLEQELKEDFRAFKTKYDEYLVLSKKRKSEALERMLNEIEEDLIEINSEFELTHDELMKIINSKAKYSKYFNPFF